MVDGLVDQDGHGTIREDQFKKPCCQPRKWEAGTDRESGRSSSVNGASPSPHNLTVGHGPMEWFACVRLAVFLDSAIDAGIHDRVSDKRLSKSVISFFRGFCIIDTGPLLTA